MLYKIHRIFKNYLPLSFDIKKSAKARNIKHQDKLQQETQAKNSRAHFNGGLLNADGFTPEFEQQMMLKIEKYLLNKFDYDGIDYESDSSELKMSKKQRKKFKKSRKKGVKLVSTGENTIEETINSVQSDEISPEKLKPVKTTPAHESIKNGLKRKRKVDCSDLSGVIVSFNYKTKSLET